MKQILELDKYNQGKGFSRTYLALFPPGNAPFCLLLKDQEPKILKVSCTMIVSTGWIVELHFYFRRSPE